MEPKDNVEACSWAKVGQATLQKSHVIEEAEVMHNGIRPVGHELGRARNLSRQ